MFLENWKKELFTVPNLLSLLRLVLLPVYLGAYLRSKYLTAGGILLLSCLTDLLDGFLARKLHQVTDLGKVLDPLADKVTQLSLMACLSLQFPALKPVLWLLIGKEAFQLALAIGFLKRGRVLSGALMAGKISTAVLFASLIALVMFPELPGALVKAAALADGLVLTGSFVSYALAYFGPSPGLQDAEG